MVNFIILDLFCGAGGFSYGFEKNPKFKTVLANDIDSKAIKTFSNNISGCKTILGDISDSKTKKELVRQSKKANVNMIIGGPPCQGFSLKGKNLGLKDNRNFLFREFLSIVRDVQPEIFIIENVKNILSSSSGWFKNQILSEVSNLGYNCNCGVLNAKYFYVPQSRERAFFICSKSKNVDMPKALCNKPVTVREAIEDLSFLNSGEGSFKQEYKFKPKSKYQIMMRGEEKFIFNHVASNHKKVALKKLELIPAEKGKEYLPKEMLGKQQYNTTWSRLVWDDASPTIDTRFDACSNGKNIHPYLHRAITAREAARIQSFDDSFIFYGNKVDVRKQIGNAVPPLLAKAIADKIDEVYRKRS